MPFRFSTPLLPVLFCAFASMATAVAAAEPALRRPVAIALTSDNRWLATANRSSGSVSLIDAKTGRVACEQSIGSQLSDIVAVANKPEFFALDEAKHEMIWLSLDAPEHAAPSLIVRQRLPVSPYPVAIAIDPDGGRLAVTSLWSHRITIVAIPAGAPGAERQLAVQQVVDLPFAPRCQLWLPQQQRLLVADSFGGTIGVVDPSSGQLLCERKFPGHNIRGLALGHDGKTVLVTHQMLNDLANSIHSDVHWGLLMSNDLRYLRIDSILDSAAELYSGGHMFPLGEAGKGAADPAAVAVAARGQAVVTLAGTDELAIGGEEEYTLDRVRVGKRPVAIALSSDGRTAYVANQFSDSVSVIDIDQREVAATISLGEQPPLTVAQQGELLFYDGRLSHDRWMSCHSCHTDGHTNGQLNDNLSDRSFGASKRVLSLLGVRDTLPLAWNGSIPSLPLQVRNSIEKTMIADDPPLDHQVEAIAAYVETLEAPPSVEALRLAARTSSAAASDRSGSAEKLEELEKGRQVFEQRQCGACHAPPFYTSPDAYDIGLTDKLGNRKFNPPSLRGLSQRSPLLHDGRASSLREVFLKHRHPNNAEYDAEEVEVLLPYLLSL